MRFLLLALAAGVACLPTASAQPAAGISREQAVRLAAQALKGECDAPTECHFSPSRLEGGWSVLVWFCRRNDKGDCEYVLGGSDNKFVFVKDDGTIRISAGT